MKEHIAPYRLFLGVVIATLLIAFWRPALSAHVASHSGTFLLEILTILPPVMILMGLMDVWLPRKLVEAHMGKDAGLLGAGVAILLGTAAAGPLYAAFPIAVSLQRKGARLANIVIFLGTWASIKIPMLMMESSFISLRFALLRLLFTVPCVILTGYLMERIIPLESLPADAVQ